MALAVVLVPMLAQQPAKANAEYVVEGGRMTIDFEKESDEKLFYLYSEFDKEPWLMDGKLYAWTLAEQKMILANHIYYNVDVSVDIHTINKNGKFDAGIYFYANDYRSNIDGIDAWCVNVEKGAGQKSFYVKLHRFKQGYTGAFAEVKGVPFTTDVINLRVVVNAGYVYAFINGAKNPILSYKVGQGAGNVGLRSFYSPNYFDNFTVTGTPHPVDKTEMQNLAEKATAELNNTLPQACIEELNSAIKLSQDAQTQTQVDEAVKALKTALENSVDKVTYQQLTELIATANELQNPDGNVYTENSWNSLNAVKDICANLTEQSSEYQISFWYEKLECRIAGLVKYSMEVA